MSKKELPKRLVHDLYLTVQFLDSIMDKGGAFARHVDAQVNILVGISSAIFIFSATRANDGLSFFILALFSSISALIALITLHPPRFTRKMGQAESYMYGKQIIQCSSSEIYHRKLIEIISNREEIVHQYAVEIYNLYKYYYRPKRLLFNMARNVLFVGVILSSLLFLSEQLVYLLKY